MGANNGKGFGWSDINVIFNILAPGVVKKHLTVGATMKIDDKSKISGSW